MSYEGYEQYLCDNGHYFEGDSWTAIEECPSCKGKVAWNNSVNETNCDGIGYVPMDQFLIHPDKTETCNMGHVHVVESAVYRIPTAKETKDAQTYYEQDGTRYNLQTKEKVGKAW